MTPNFVFKLLPDVPVLICTVDENYQIGSDHITSTAELLRILDQQSQPVVYILDLLKLKFNFNEILEGASRVSRGKNPAYHHPNMKKLIVITANSALADSFRGLDNPVFGNVQAHVFSTVEAALVDARADVTQ